MSDFYHQSSLVSQSYRLPKIFFNFPLFGLVLSWKRMRRLLYYICFSEYLFRDIDALFSNSNCENLPIYIQVVLSY